jgi:hypothetical protein
MIGSPLSDDCGIHNCNIFSGFHSGLDIGHVHFSLDILVRALGDSLFVLKVEGFASGELMLSVPVPPPYPLA